MKRLCAVILALLLALVIGFAARTWLFSAVRISGTSMENTLFSGDVLLVTRFGQPSRGSVMQCRFEGRSGEYIKRVIGIPGDTVEFSAGQLILNGKPLSEPYVSSRTEDMCVTLSEKRIFCAGRQPR